MDSTTPLVNLLQKLSQWRDALEALHYTVAEDRPGDLAVADLCESAVGDIAGWLEDAAQGVRRSALAVEREDDTTAASALATAHRQMLKAILHQTEQLLGAEQQGRMQDLPRRGPAWAGWLRIVRASTDGLPRLTHEAQEAFLQTWEHFFASRWAVRRSAVPTGAAPPPVPVSIN